MTPTATTATTATAGTRRASPQALLLAMIVVWGLSYAAVKAPLDRGVPPFVLLSARFWLATLCLLPLTLLTNRGELRRERGRGVLTGLALLIGYALQTLGMQQTTASMAGFLAGLIVLLVAVGGVVLGERLRPATVFGLLLGAVGLALLCFGGTSASDGPARVNTWLGIGLQVGSSVSYAMHILLLGKLGRRGGELAYCQWQLTTVAVGVSLPLPFVDWGAVATYATDPVVLTCIGYLGPIALSLGIAVQSRVQPQIPPSQAAVLFATQPAFAALGGLVFLGDRLGALEWTGGALIITGVLISELLRRRGLAAAAAGSRPPAAARS